MNKAFINITNGQLSYIERGRPNSPTIFFIHGNSSSSSIWEHQLRDEHLLEYRLIAFDLPGHGDSFKAENPGIEYRPIETARIILEAIQLLQEDKPFLLIGFSYGCNLCAELIDCGLKPNGVMLIGPSILGKNYGPERVLQPLSSTLLVDNETDRNAVLQFFADHINIDKSAIEEIVNDYYQTDVNFRKALINAVIEGRITDEVDTLENFNKEIAVVVGEFDRVVQPFYLSDKPFQLWKEEIIHFKGGHWIHCEQPQVVNDCIRMYAEETLNQTLF